MSRKNCLRLLLMILALLVSGLASEAAQVKKPSTTGKTAIDTWALAGREGGCAPISILERRGPEFSHFQTPYELVEKLKAAKIKADIKEYNAGDRRLVEVRVPDRGVYVMFVPTKTCTKFLDKK